MALATYKISDLSIEYFKGFSSRQTLSFAGKNVFIFGENGNGKSSIIEAIRWCLFGTSDVEVRNVLYESEVCRVSLVLEGESGKVTVRRELKPGRNRSETHIVNDKGKVLKLGDVLPQIAKVGEHESAQVIFAAQQAESRSIRPNITEFGKVLCFFLKLDDVPDLIKALNQLLQEQKAVTETLGKRVEGIADRYRQQQDTLQKQIDTVLANPPWGEGSAPTAPETDKRIKTFVLDLSKRLGREMPASLSSEQALQKAGEWIDHLTAIELATFQKTNEQLAARIGLVESLLGKIDDASTLARNAEERREGFEETLVTLLAGGTRKQLVDDIQTLEADRSQQAATYAVVEQVARLCDEHDVTDCPACGSKFKVGDLSRQVMFQLGTKATSLSEGADGLDDKRRALREADAAAEAMSLAEAGQADALHKHTVLLNELTSIFDDEVSLDEARRELTQWKAEQTALGKNQGTQRSEKQQLKSLVTGYQQELKCHSLRLQRKELDRRLTTGMDDVRKCFRDHQDYLHQINEIKVLVESEFRRAIDRLIPRLDRLLTTVYLRLTRQKQFQRVKIYHHPDKAGDLEVMVATDRQPDRNHSADKLNGQAKKALHLVPYFVFSRLFHTEVMELELLLIDDPSESFDTSHVGFLVEELRQASEHAQVIAASHEQEKFAPRIEDHFEPNSYVTLVVSGFESGSGPRID